MSEIPTALDVFEKYNSIGAAFVKSWPPERLQNLHPDLKAFIGPDLPISGKLIVLFSYLSLKSEKGKDTLKSDEAIAIGGAMVWVHTLGLEDQPLPSSAFPSTIQHIEVLRNLSQTDACAISVYLRWLSFHHLWRYERVKDFDHLEIAIAIFQKIIDVEPTGEFFLPGNSYLCRLLLLKFRRNLDFETLASAISHGRASLRDADDDNYPRHLSNLAVALHDRYVHYNTADDLDASILLLHYAVDIATTRQWSAEDRLSLRHNLASILATKMERSEKTSAIGEECIHLLRQILSDTPSDHRYHMLRQYNLATMLSRASRYDQDAEKVNEAIAMFERLTDEKENLDAQLRTSAVINLGLSLLFRYMKLQSNEDLDRGVKIGEEILKQLPLNTIGPYDLSLIRSLLAISYWERYQGCGNLMDLEVSLEHMRSLTHTSMCPREMALTLSVYSAHINHKEDRFEDAMLDYRAALDLLPQYLLSGRMYKTQEALFDSLGGSAAAASVACGRYQDALELLEVGRSIGWTRALQMRSKFDQLEADYPEYAKRFKRLSESLDGMDLSQTVIDPSQSENTADQLVGLNEAPWEQRFSLSQRWDTLLGEIRKLEGYEDFLTKPRYEQFKSVSDRGPVVVINISGYRSDVFILTQSTLDRPHVVRLPKNMDKISKEWSDSLLIGVEKMQEGLITNREFGKAVLRPILTELWEIIIEPIRLSLASLAPYARRIWLCPTGQLTFLPLHFVINGLRDGVNDTFLPLIPSYTTTLSSLLRARPSSLEQRPQVSLLAVTCESVRNFGKILGAKKEVEVLGNMNRGNHIMTILQGPSANVEGVLSGMAKHSWLHLACHGISSSNEPYRSHFMLNDGPLYLSDIVSTHLDRVEFAFLSACHSATGVPYISDEAMHLAAGLQFAGYRGTIATMWSVHDTTARKLAEKVYSFMFRDYDEGPNVEDAAEALWRAIKALRDDGIPYSRLAPFIHLGI